MNAVFKLLQLLPTLFPILKALVQLAEQIGGDGTGPDKLKFVLDTVLNLLVEFNVVEQADADSFRRVLTIVVNSIVSFFNARGWNK